MLRLRQIALVAQNLKDAASALSSTLEVQECYRDPDIIHFGLENVLYAVGDQFVEIVSPVRDNTTAGRLLTKQGGDGGYMAIFQVDDLAPVETRVADRGIRVVHDGAVPGIRGIHLHPKDVPGAIVSVDCATPQADWPWAGDRWRDQAASSQVAALAGLTVRVGNPEQVAETWAAVLGADVANNRIRVDDATIAFQEPNADGRTGITGVQLLASRAELVGTTHHLLGVKIELVDVIG